MGTHCVRRWTHAVSATLLRTEALRAAALVPGELRSLDAIHLTAALSLGDDLDELVTYDARLAAAASACGLPTSSPA